MTIMFTKITSYMRNSAYLLVFKKNLETVLLIGLSFNT